ncbi:hypothetical protein KDK_21000 [Dictyobacter kobayashii]|uniref:Uncharacterized protein n=1 Tax=Dictyobacter kobayashii TaxID=2014872 RepID=A0A402AGR8_9CHLR|nr:hypothetical protein KDK_21000 [Dictyobacter kobayashii]
MPIGEDFFSVEGIPPIGDVPIGEDFFSVEGMLPIGEDFFSVEGMLPIEDMLISGVRSIRPHPRSTTRISNMLTMPILPMRLNSIAIPQSAIPSMTVPIFNGLCIIIAPGRLAS